MRRHGVMCVLTVVILSGCALPSLDGASVRCVVDADCPSPQLCVVGLDDERLCRAPGDPCVSVSADASRQLPDGATCAGGICVEGGCVAPTCGDGITTAPESCDDGALNSDTAPGACRLDCSLARCGDGVVDEDEFCDDGGANSDDDADACRTDCIAAACGDGVIDTGEFCDEGPQNDDQQPDACRTDCLPARCGDNIRDSAEDCDEGGLNSDVDPDACRVDCRRARCGDGVIDTDEVCDEGDTESGDGCRGDCRKVEDCGDGILDEGEACDDANDNPRDGCDGCQRQRWSVDVVARGRSLGDALALTGPQGVATDVTGAVYIADTGAHRILRRDANGTQVFAGTGSAGLSGDGGPAIAAELRGPTDVVVASNGDVYIADRLNNRVRRVTTDGVIRTLVGGGPSSSNDGDGGGGTNARLRRPRGLALLDDTLLIAEDDGGRVRQTSLNGGNVRTLVGNGTLTGPLLDGASLTGGSLRSPVDVVAINATDFVIAERGSGTLRLVRTAPTSISTVAGGGLGAPPPDGVPVAATSVALLEPTSLIADGNTVLLADATHRRVFAIDIQSNPPLLRTIVGTGSTGPLADGVDPLGVDLARPVGLAGNLARLFIADETHHVARAVSLAGVLTIAGTGSPGVDIEGALATTVTLVDPIGVASDRRGGIYIADRGARRVLHRSPAGHVRTVVGNGDAGDPISGAPAAGQPITPSAIATRVDGTLVISTLEERSAGAIYSIDGSGVLSTLVDLAAANLVASRVLPLTVDELDRVVFGGNGFLAVEVPAADSPIPGFTVFDLAATGPVNVLASLSSTTVVLAGKVALSVVTLEFSETRASIEAIPNDTPGPLGLLHLPDGDLLVGSQEDGIQRLTLTGTLTPVISRADSRDGDGLPLAETSVQDPAGLALDVDGSILIADSLAGLVRRIHLDGVGLTETLAGDLHPAGPGTLPTAALYSPRVLVSLRDGSLLAAGSTGRVTQVVFDGVPRIDVVVGHPFGPFDQRPPLGRFVPLRTDDFVVAPDPTRNRVQLIDQNARQSIDLAGPASSWVLSPEGGGLTGGLTEGLVLADGRLVVSNRVLDCVHTFPRPNTQPIPTFFGSCGFEGSFDGLVRDPGGLAEAPSGAIYLADTSNNRVLRRDPVDFTVSVVIGDGSASSAGQGRPARELPLQAPAHVAVDRFGNLFVSSTTTVRMVANVDGDADADGDDEVITIYGAGARNTFPESESRCLGGLALDDDGDRVYVADACSSFLVGLTPVAVVP